MADSAAVVGAGMFGIATAIELGKSGIEVTLFERKDDILAAASYSNQWRLHRGYHYPQSDETAESCRTSEPMFREMFGDAVITDRTHYYAIANESWVPPSEYTAFCDKHGLAYEPVDTDLISDDTIATTLRVEENHVSPDHLRRICWDKLDTAGVTVETNSEVASVSDVKGYDYQIVATYASINSILPDSHPLQQEYRFEVCEIPVVQLPDRYHGTNIIVVYGPFMSTDHWGDSNLFAMGDYENMVHHSNVGYKPEVPEEYTRILNQGLVKNAPVSNFADFRETGRKYIPGVADANHMGSLFTVRTKLSDVEDTDARPSLVRQSNYVITVFGGKLSTSIQTAEEVRERVC